MKNIKNKILGASLIVTLLLAHSCAPSMIQSGFLKSYDKIQKRPQGIKSIPSFYSVKDGVDFTSYKKVIVLDFYALTTEKDLVKVGYGNFSSLKKELAENIARYLQSNGAFEQCERVSEDIRFDDVEAIRQLGADAVLMGNISDFRTSRRGVSDQFEIKLIDVASGETVMTAIDNNSTPLQAVAMPLTFGRVLKLIRIAKGQEPMPTVQGQPGFM